jgi:surface polysaccharide O-acyltransferase-like enzyme
VHNWLFFLISGYIDFREKMSLFQEAFEPLENIAVCDVTMQLSKHEGVHSV